ncbi:MAG TPA: 2'-5' RNA ligase family protein [Acidimicrobiales bacterium]|nr:2'-5' RNA ligase family protein [Acidimicrobiales bacterium]
MSVSLSVLDRAAASRLGGAAANRVSEVLVPASQYSFSGTDVVEVVSAVGARVPCWVGGGWGVDALLGVQTRYHTDLDLLVEDVGRDRRAVEEALAALGYRYLRPGESGAWWKPEAAVMARGRGSVIEVLSVEPEVLVAAAELLTGSVNGEGPFDLYDRGVIAGRPVPCLSRAAQRLFHLGYLRQPGDPDDMELLAADRRPATPAERRPGTGRTALIVPLFIADPGLRRLLHRTHPALEMPYATVFWPYLDPSEVDAPALAAAVASQPAFDVSFERVGWFGDRVAFLQPTRPEPLIELTRTVADRHPGLEPYEGRFKEVIPHVTIGEDLPVARLRALAAQAERRLPVQVRAEQVAWVAVGEDGRFDVLSRFPLGRHSSGGNQRS